MFLSDRQLRNIGPRLIEPFALSRVQPASYDCSLGAEFIVFDAHEQVHIDLARPEEDNSARRVLAPERFVLHPHEFVLGVTEEVVSIPDNIVGRLEGKSTVGRTGVMIHVTAGYLDPGFHGPVTLEIFNLRKVPIILRPGLAFCQISFAWLDGKVDQPYNGRYQNAVGVEASKSMVR